MPKIADRYYDIEPWAVQETGFDPQRQRNSESVFSLANEFMGVRGYFEEGYSDDMLLGSYFNQLYEEMPAQHPQVFKGMITRVCFGVNAVDWLYTRVWLGDEQLDLARCRFTQFERRLDMHRGILTRSFVWETADGKQLRVAFERFCSMARTHLGAQRITFEPLNFSGTVRVQLGLDFGTCHEIADGWNQTNTGGVEQVRGGRNFWTEPQREYADDLVTAMARTVNTDIALAAAFRPAASVELDWQPLDEAKRAILQADVPLTEGQAVTIDKQVVCYWQGAASESTTWNEARDTARSEMAPSYDDARRAHADYWRAKWQDIDIAIDGDTAIQQGLRFSLFNVQQTFHGGDETRNIPCKGLTGEVYYGQTFWDSETYASPFYLFTEPVAARALLRYRYRQLPQACRRARELDCRGARYPMCTIDGTESCATWQHGDFEIHVSVGVAHAIWHYVKHTDDKDFLYVEGIEMLLQICRYYASRGAFSPLTGEFGLWGVMGPDEYHMNVNNNAYTNYMVKRAFEYTLAVLDEMAARDPQRRRAVIDRVELENDELAAWRDMAARMRIPQNRATGVYEQHDGYFDLPEVDVKNISEDEIPIYKHWAYLRIFRHNMIKQPDWLLVPLFHSQDFTLENKRLNYEFYEARCVHESSLSPSIHSIFAAELGKLDQAYDFLVYATRLDLDNYNKNVEQGLHVTSMTGAWWNMIYGFGGLRTDGDVLVFNPSLPAAWRGFRFRLRYRGARLDVNIDRRQATFQVSGGPPVDVAVFGIRHTIGREPVSVPLQPLGRTVRAVSPAATTAKTATGSQPTA